MTELARAIKALRMKAGSHAKFAVLADVTANTVIQWEKGVFPKSRIERLVELGVPRDLLERAAEARKPRSAELADLEAQMQASRKNQTEALGLLQSLVTAADDLRGAVAGLRTELAALRNDFEEWRRAG